MERHRPTHGHARLYRSANLAAAKNKILEQLPRQVRIRLLSLCEPIQLVLAEVLSEPGAPITHVYFPTEGFISLITLLDGHAGLEVGMVGFEGMLGAELVLGVASTPLRALVQGAGAAWRMDAAVFRKELDGNKALQQLLSRYLFVRMAQLASSAACLRFHLIGPRLARWLLMTQDRARSDSFQVTQEFLAYMLGVRRVGVTSAARALQHSGLIEYHRGELTVLDRKGLEAASCGCYASEQLAYSTMFP